MWCRDAAVPRRPGDPAAAHGPGDPAAVRRPGGPTAARRPGGPTAARLHRGPGVRVRWLGRALVLGLSALLLTAVGAGEARATEYRYWSFWTGDGEGGWRYATQGPSLLRPADGTSVGFRFTVSAAAGADAQRHTPRDPADFAEVCGDTPAESGRKRLALAIDFGTAAEAPDGQTPPRPRTVCAQVPKDASAAEALAETAGSLRYDSAALLCAIADYPRTGCGEPVSGDRAADERDAGERGGGDQSSGDEGGGPSLGLVAGACAVVLLGGAALWRSRRRRG